MMSDQLPEGWVWVRIKDVISQISLTNRKLHQRDYLDGGSYPVVDQGQKLIGGYTDQDLLVPCELPVIVFGDHTKAIKFIDFPFVAGADGIKVIKPDKVFFAKLFYYFLFAIELPNKGYARHFQYLEKEFIPLPPLAEQERIVAKIEALFSQLDAGVAALRRIQAALKRYKASVLKAACGGRLVPQDPTDEPAEALLRRLGKAPLVDDDLPALPEGWCWVRVGDITAPVEKVLPQNKYSDQFIYLDISSIDNMKHSIVEPKRYSKSEAPSRARQLVQTNDILFSTVRTYLENVAMVPEIYDGQIASTGFSVLRPGAMVVPKFMFYYILTNSFLEPLNELQRGTSYPAVRDGDVRIQPFPLPPLGEQEAITSQLEQRLSVVAEVEAVVAALLARSVRLRQSILKQAFEGKLV